MDLEGEEEDEESKDGEEFEKREKSVVRGRDLRLRNRSMHRKARSMSPLNFFILSHISFSLSHISLFSGLFTLYFF